MKYMLLIYADEQVWTDAEREQCYLDSTQLTHELKARGRYLGASPLQSVATATSGQVRGSRRTGIDGPFPETKELIAGFWIFQVKSKQEAIEWVKRCPNPMPGESEIEIRQIFEAEDFGAELTPALREQEERLRMNITKTARQ